MAKLWNKFLVIRRDGSIPEWPWLIMGGRDPAAPTAIRAYAEKCFRLGMDQEYVDDLMSLASEFEIYRAEHGDGDPEAGPHRVDDPDIVSAINRTNATVNHRKGE